MARALLKGPTEMMSEVRTHNETPAPDAQQTRSERGVTLVEMAVALGIVAVLAAVSAPFVGAWRQDIQTRDMARQVADALMIARAEAIRTGNRHVVYFGNLPATDPVGTPLPPDPRGGTVPILVINDGPPGGTDCLYNGGDEVHIVNAAAPPGVFWGQNLSAGTLAPNDPGIVTPPIGPFFPGTNFVDGANNARRWVLFRADGIPVGFDGAGCNLGAPGSGAGVVYITDGPPGIAPARRDYAVVLTALGSIRVHVWDASNAAWRL